MAQESQSRGNGKYVVDKVEARADQVGGRIEMSADVVATIAGLAAREVAGIHSLGKSRLIGGDSPTRGVSAEVGEKQAALDIQVVLEQGYDVRDVADEVRRRVAMHVDRTAGREVVEVNLDVIGIHFPEEDKEEAKPPTRRVE